MTSDSYVSSLGKFFFYKYGRTTFGSRYIATFCCSPPDLQGDCED